MSIFSIFSANDETPVLSTEVTTGLWSPDETGSLFAVFTSSIQKDISGEYFYDLYNLNPAISANNAEVQFSVAYGHINGGGSPVLDPNVLGGQSVLPTQVIYSQYRNVLLSSGSKFTFGQTPSDDIYVININRARLKQALDPGNWELGLSGINGVSTFVDDFGVSNTVSGNIIASNVYNVRSGSLTAGTASFGNDTVYGLVFPDYGTIILHPAAISSSVGFSGSSGTGNLNAVTNIAGPFAPYTGSAAQSYQFQHEALFRSIASSMAANVPFVARGVEKISSKNYSIYLRYNEYNYTNNPSYYSINSAGAREILPVFKDNPITYITTVGLYNEQNELLAVAKLSRPLQKSNDKAALIRVRLDY